MYRAVAVPSSHPRKSNSWSGSRTIVGAGVGAAVAVGAGEGINEGAKVGDAVGPSVGSSDGSAVGVADGVHESKSVYRTLRSCTAAAGYAE